MAGLLLDIYPREMKAYAMQKPTWNVHSSCIHNHSKLETNQRSINRELDKQIVIYPQNRITFSNKKEETADIHNRWMNLK